jgi:hypothetical protein
MGFAPLNHPTTGKRADAPRPRDADNKMAGSSVSARGRGATSLCPTYGAEAAPSGIRTEKILPDAAPLGERIDLVLRHFPERRASGADRIVLEWGVARERRRGCEKNQRYGKCSGGEAKIHGRAPGIRTPPSRIWFHEVPVESIYVENTYNEQGALHRSGRSMRKRHGAILRLKFGPSSEQAVPRILFAQYQGIAGNDLE